MTGHEWQHFNNWIWSHGHLWLLKPDFLSVLSSTFLFKVGMSGDMAAVNEVGIKNVQWSALALLFSLSFILSLIHLWFSLIHKYNFPPDLQHQEGQVSKITYKKIFVPLNQGTSNCLVWYNNWTAEIQTLIDREDCRKTIATSLPYTKYYSFQST